MIDNPIKIKKVKNLQYTNREKLLMEESDKIRKKRSITENPIEDKYKHLTPFLNIIPPDKKKEPQFIQPPMRFKPKNDYEKVYDALVCNHYSFKNEHGRKIINRQLTKKKKKKEEKEDSELDSEFDSDSENEKNSQNDSEDSDIKKYFVTKNLRTKKLHSDLHDKTYFRAVENFPLFGSTMLNKNEYAKSKKYPSFKLKQNTKNKKINRWHYGSDDIYDMDANIPNTNYNSNMDFINFLSQVKKPEIANDIFKKFEKTNFSLKDRKKEDKNKNDKTNSIQNLNKLKEIAFKTSYDEDDEAYGGYGNDGELNYDHIKNAERIIIDGKEYLKSDIRNISKTVLKNCNFTELRKPNLDYDLHKGDGKVMCTKGLTINEFQRKFGLKA